MALAFLALAWLLGVAAAAFTAADPAGALAASGLLGVVSFALRPRSSTLALALAGSALIFAAGWRYEATQPRPPPVARFNDGPSVRLRAVVSDDPDERASYRVYRLEVRRSWDRGRWRDDSGGVLMYAPLFPKYEYGDLLEIAGRLETPPQLTDFDFRRYLLHRGVGSVMSFPKTRRIGQGEGSSMRAALVGIRTSLADSVSSLLPEPEASLAIGSLLGGRSRLPRDLVEGMDNTGTSHLIAVSGQNVSLLAGLMMAGLAWAVGRRPAAWAALVGIVFYCALVGGQASVVRAGIMGAIYVVAVAVGRQNMSAVALVLAGAAMTAWDPQLAHDVSFQLSFAATLGLMVMAPGLVRLLTTYAPAAESPAVRPLTEALAMTVAAVVFTAPVTAIVFHRVSLTAPIANVLAVPAFATVAVLSGVAAAVNLALPWLARPLAWLAWLPAAYTVEVVNNLKVISPLTLDLGSWGTPVAIVWYSAAFGAARWLERLPLPAAARAAPAASRRLVLPAAVGAALVGLSVVVWLTALSASGKQLRVTVLDVGQGDAILVEDSAGHRILVDGGPSAAAIESALGRHLPFYDRRIDLVILTHAQADHVGGLPAVLDHYQVGAVIEGSSEAESEAYLAWQRAVEESGAQRVQARRGQYVELASGARLTVLAPIVGVKPEAPNESSVVLKLELGGVSFLLTGDMGEDEEKALLRLGTDLRANVLKVGHHGSRTSTSAAFLRRVRPEVDVISVSAANRFGHPSPEVLERLRGDLVLRTDVHGDVTVSVGGERLLVRTQRRIDGATHAARGSDAILSVDDPR